MSVIKLKALERLRDIIAREVKELRGRICAGPATRDHRKKLPSLAIVPSRFDLFLSQCDPVDLVTGEERSYGPKTAIFDVGRWEGTLLLTLFAATPAARYALEFAIEQVFLGNADGTAVGRQDVARANWLRPGILTVDVPECDNSRCAFELVNGSWRNEKVMSNEHGSVLRVTAQLPVLVRAKGIPRMDTLKLSLTEDFETEITSAAQADLLPDIETVEVQADGTVA